MELREQPELGARIRELRIAAGLEQATLATAINVRQPDVSKIERGERSISGAELFRVADALGVTVDDILVPEGALQLQGAFRLEGATDDGARQAIELVEKLARELDHLRALAP